MLQDLFSQEVLLMIIIYNERMKYDITFEKQIKSCVKINNIHKIYINHS